MNQNMTCNCSDLRLTTSLMLHGWLRHTGSYLILLSQTCVGSDYEGTQAMRLLDCFS